MIRRGRHPTERRQETGVGRRETGDGRRETGDGRREKNETVKIDAIKARGPAGDSRGPSVVPCLPSPRSGVSLLQNADVMQFVSRDDPRQRSYRNILPTGRTVARPLIGEETVEQREGRAAHR